MLVEVVEDLVRGRCLVATQAIEAGALVLQELPLLQAITLGEANTAAAQLQAFCEAEEDARNFVLHDLYIPDLSAATPESHTRHMLEETLEQVNELRLKHGWAQKEAPETLQRALLAFNLNAHSFSSGSAIFRIGSRLNHACDANTLY